MSRRIGECRHSLPGCRKPRIVDLEIFENFVLVIPVLELQVRHSLIATPEPESVHVREMQLHPCVEAGGGIAEESAGVNQDHCETHCEVAALGPAMQRTNLVQDSTNIDRQDRLDEVLERILVETAEGRQRAQGERESLHERFVRDGLAASPLVKIGP